MDPKYYQGMLRKHQQLKTQMERWVEDDNHREAIKEALENPALSSSERPAKGSPELILLWELQQTTEMLEVADQSLAPSEQRQMSMWDRFVAALRSMFSIEQNPAERPVEELRDLLTESLVKAENATAEPGSRLDYSPTEFCKDPKIIDDETINTENNSRKIREFIENKRDELSSSSIAHLEHRIKACQKIERLEKNTTYHPPKERCTITRNGEVISEAEYEPGDKIMLNGVHERRSQNTLNGCWSVSLCSQLEYRGINLTQEEIRAYRPNDNEINGSVGYEGKPYYSQNNKQAVSAYFGLVGRTMPNTVAHHYVNTGRTEAAREEMRQVIVHALTKDNSPLCMSANGHYRTIVGIKGDRVYFKDPLRIVGRPESVDSMTLEEMQKIGSRGLGVELSWFKDVKPTLGGSIQPDPQLAANGVAFINGKACLPSLNADVKNDLMLKHSGQLVMQGHHDEQTTTAAVTMFIAKDLGYTRLPGGRYNAEALDGMMQTLSQVPGAESRQDVRAILEHAEALKNGIYRDDPTEGMLDLAKLYQEAIRNQKEESPLKEILLEQLTEIRDAVVETVRGRYQPKVGDLERNMVSVSKSTEPANDVERALAAKQLKAYENMKEGMSGMLYLHTLVRETTPEDSKWIDALQSKNVTEGVEKLKNDTAFGNMIDKMYDNASKYQYYVDDVVKAGNSVEDTKKAYEKKLKEEQANNKNKKQAEIAKLKKQIENPSGREEKSLEQLKKEYDDAKAWQEKVNQRDPKARTKFLEEMGLKEEDHMNPYEKNRTLKKHVSREREEIIKLNVLRGAIKGGDATELYGRYLKEQHKLMEQEKKVLNQNGKETNDLSKENSEKEKEIQAGGDGVVKANM